MKRRIKTKLKGKAKELAIEEFKRLNLTKSEIEAGTRIFANNKWVIKTENYFVRPYLLGFFYFTLAQLFLCTLAFIWAKGCCFFRPCSCYKAEGYEDEKGAVYVNYEEYD